MGIDGIQVNRSIFLRLAAREESDSGYCGRHGALESLDSGFSNLLGSVFGLARLTGCHHVGLQQSSFQVNVVVVESLVDSGQNGLGHLLGTIQVVITVREHFRLDDRDQSVSLADRSIASLN